MLKLSNGKVTDLIQKVFEYTVSTKGDHISFSICDVILKTQQANPADKVYF